jgi:hypothetical protein
VLRINGTENPLGVTSIKGILCTLTICWRRIQRSSKSKNCPKPHYVVNTTVFGQASETAKWLGSRAWNCPTTRPKSNAPNKGGALRAINAPPQNLNVHKFPFIEVPPRRLQPAELPVHACFGRGLAGARDFAIAHCQIAVGSQSEGSGPDQGSAYPRVVPASRSRIRLESGCPGSADQEPLAREGREGTNQLPARTAPSRVGYGGAGDTSRNETPRTLRRIQFT